jgi:hypothetical protein
LSITAGVSGGTFGGVGGAGLGLPILGGSAAAAPRAAPGSISTNARTKAQPRVNNRTSAQPDS